MLKFLFYLFLFYVIYKLIVGRVTGGTTFKTKVFRFDTHHHHYNKTEKPEGSVTVNPKVKQAEKKDTGKIGEYVDYEEIK